MKTHPLAKLTMRGRIGISAGGPEVRPTATDASTPSTAATYNHSSVSDIIEKIRTSAMAKGAHWINRKELGAVCSVVGISMAEPAGSYRPPGRRRASCSASLLLAGSPTATASSVATNREPQSLAYTAVNSAPKSRIWEE